MRSIRVLCIIVLGAGISGLAGCADDGPPTALGSGGSDISALASDVDGVPDCGFEGGAACPVLTLPRRCDRGLQHVGAIPPLFLGGICVNDTRHLVGAGFRGTWLDWALQNQRTLAVDEPINWVMHLATHNANNNVADGETLDPNQAWSISDQLDLGSRSLWLDPHWVASRVRLCHGADVAIGPELHPGCGPGDREFGYAVKEIATWLAANPEEIIMIDLEAYVEGQTSPVANALNAFLGSKLFRQSDRPSLTQWPSRRELLAMGKQVIVGARGVDFAGTTHENGYLLGRGDIRLIRHFGVDRTAGIVTACFGGNAPRETILQTDEFFRGIAEDRTALALYSPEFLGFYLGTTSRENVADLAACGIRLISLDLMGAPIPTLHPTMALELGKLLVQPNRFPLVDRRPALVWSWREGDRGGSGDAALLDGSTGRWSSAPTSGLHRFACARPRSETVVAGRAVDAWPDSLGRQWRVTQRTGEWREGGRACLDEFGAQGFVFSVPVHGFMNGQLRLANASGENVWLNYNDIEAEGDWVINHRPIANASAPETVECTGHHGTPVQLNGSASTDVDGHPITFEWRGPFGVVTGVQPTVLLPVGRHEITMIADDGFGGTSSDVVVVNVVDTKPPEIRSAVPTPSSLWAPNHKMVPVTVALDVHDICDANPTCRIVSVASDEPANGKGDGNTSPDWRITGALTVELRAERSGSGKGRVYTLTVQCTDASGNSATRNVLVTVAHDQRKSD